MAPHFDLHEQQTIPTKRSYWFLFLTVAAAAAAVFLIFVRLPVSEPASIFCGKACHSMNPSYQSWRRSPHAVTACLSCHSNGSIASRFIRLFELSAKHIPKERTARYRPIKVAGGRGVPDEACVGCHKPKDRVKTEGRIMDHKAHKAIDLRCLDCHNRGPHEDSQEYAPIAAKAKKPSAYKDYMTMTEGCWRCHKRGGAFVMADGKTIVGPYKKGKAVASTKCGSCHPGFARLKLRKDVERVWRRHIKKPPWRQGTVHGETACQVEFKPCKVCHNPKQRCTVCHNGVSMPHAENWIAATQHGAVAKATQAKPCRICHELKQVPGCSRNGHHHEEFVVANKLDLKKAPWKSGRQRHGPVARATQAVRCRQCHDQATWCTTQCHRGVTMPHGPEWRKVHFTAVGYTPGSFWSPKPTPCDLCHNTDRKDPKFCVRCHHKALVPPNLPNGQVLAIEPMTLGRNVYGLTRSLNGGIKICGNCHILQFCWRCHQDFSDRDEED